MEKKKLNTELIMSELIEKNQEIDKKEKLTL